MTNASEVNWSGASPTQYWRWGRRMQDLVHSDPSKISDLRTVLERNLELW